MRSFHRNLSFVALSLVVAACGDDNGGGPDNTAPTANFAAPTCDFATLTCTFTDASTDGDGSIASRAWTFENGTPATSTEATQEVVFSAAGPNTVTLTVTDNEGATDDFSSGGDHHRGGQPAADGLVHGELRVARVHLHQHQHRRRRHHRQLRLGLRRSDQPGQYLDR